MRFQRSWMPAVLAALALTACGGGGSDTGTRVSISSVKVMGDSLADSGTFGFKFTVKGDDTLVFSERVAQTFGLTLCNHYTATSATTFVVNPTNPACTNYAIGGGRINNYSAPTSKVSIVQQLQDAAAAGSYGAGDLILLDGGANDAADLIGAFLTADSGASYSGLLSTLLTPASVGTALASGTTGAATIGATYMTALADKFAVAITTSVLGNGAQRVAILNVPSILNTPRLKAALAAVAAASGGGDTGAAASAQYAGIFNSWINAYNTELAAKFAGNSNVVIVDFFTALNDDVASPAQYSLTNVTTAACPSSTLASSGLIATGACTDALLSAMTPPDGATGGSNWWKTYLFADNFHPTPYGHDLLARYVSRALAIAGWL